MITADLMADRRFHKLGKSEVGPKAQLLFLALQPFADDQGRLSVDPDAVKLRIAPAIPAISPDEIPSLIKAISKSSLGIVYRDKGEAILQIVDWNEWNKNLRHKERSDFPAPRGWVDEVRSWKDDPTLKGSEAWVAQNQTKGDRNGMESHSARRSRQKIADNRGSADLSLKSRTESEANGNEEQSPHPNTESGGFQEADQAGPVAEIFDALAKALRANRVCPQPASLIDDRSGAMQAIRSFRAEGMDPAWLSRKLPELVRRARLPVHSLRFFEKVLREDWQRECARTARTRQAAGPEKVGSIVQRMRVAP